MLISQYLRGAAAPFKVPEASSFHVGEHTPELQQTERMLKSLGLKDPWIRNEVWRYDRRQVTRQIPGYTAQGVLPISQILLKGCGMGFAIACVTAGIHYYRKEDHGHH